MVVIPAIDIIDGRCVRLTKGDYGRVSVYGEDPVEVAREFEDAGFRYLHVVDLDGARNKKIVNYTVLEKIAAHTNLHIDFGGGVQSDEDIKIAFNSGAEQITGGSIAVRDPEVFGRWIRDYGTDKIILGADVRGRDIAVSGWQESSGQDWPDFMAFYRDQGIRYVISTDVDRDGTLTGPSMELYSEMQDLFPEFSIIASGGVSSLEDVKQLAQLQVYGVIVGKAIYEGKMDLNALQKYDN